jgi:hypothetical protein
MDIIVKIVIFGWQYIINLSVCKIEGRWYEMKTNHPQLLDQVDVLQ